MPKTKFVLFTQYIYDFCVDFKLDIECRKSINPQKKLCHCVPAQKRITDLFGEKKGHEEALL